MSLSRFKDAIDGFEYALEKLRVTRRAGFFFTLWITGYSVTVSADLAQTVINQGGAAFDVAAVIAAIMVPVTGLQGAVINFYHQGRANVLSP